MQSTIILTVLVAIGAVIQLISLFIIKRLVNTLTIKQNHWKALGIAVMFFFVGYIVYGITLWTGHDFISADVITSVIFFLGAIFVLVVCTMSHDTIKLLQELVELKQEVVTDALMQIYNRRFLDTQIEHEFTRAIRYGLKFSVAIIDVDYFKKINDTHGHHIGDLVLKRLGRLLRDNIRKSDYVGRYGGEEIMLILPETNEDGAYILSEKLRGIVQTTPVVYSNEICFDHDLYCTVSIGVACFNSQRHKHFKDLLRDADNALYKAKSSGRNKVCRFSDAP